MTKMNELFPVTWRAIHAIDERCESTSGGHTCVGSDSAECWWRRTDPVELASIFERMMGLSRINTFLLNLEQLRPGSDPETTARAESVAGREGQSNPQFVPIPAKLLDEASLLLARISGPRPGVLCQKGSHELFTLRPLQLPREAHVGCDKCDRGASMAKEDASGVSYLCCLHIVEVAVEMEVRSR